MTLEEIRNKYPEAMAAVEDGEDLIDYYDLYVALYELWVEEMPYGTAKARDGDPFDWIMNRLDNITGASV